MVHNFKSAIIVALLILAQAVECHAQKISKTYSCISNRKAVAVYEFGPGGKESICLTNIYKKGKQRITITAPEDIQSFTILPKSAAIKGKAEGNALSFAVRGSKRLHIQMNELPCLELTTCKPEKKSALRRAKADYHYAPGEHFVGILELKDGESVRIEEGAVVHGNIRGEGDNINISGRGILNGTVQFQNCDNLQIKDITICNDIKSWTNTLTCCTNSSYRNVKVFSCGADMWQDGINPIACKDFTIENCLIRSVDDCIAIKSFVADKNGDMGSRNITVKHCVMIGWCRSDGVTIGYELNGGEVKNILIQDCDILRANGSGCTGGHSAFSIVCDGVADVHDITYDNIRITSDISPKNLELIVTDGNLFGPDEPGQIHDITMRNVSWENEALPFIIRGREGHVIRNILFDNCTIAGKPMRATDDATFTMEYTENIRFSGK